MWVQSCGRSPVSELRIGFLDAIASPRIHRPKIWYKVIPLRTRLFVPEWAVSSRIVAVCHLRSRFTCTMQVMLQSFFVL